MTYKSKPSNDFKIARWKGRIKFDNDLQVIIELKLMTGSRIDSSRRQRMASGRQVAVQISNQGHRPGFVIWDRFTRNDMSFLCVSRTNDFYNSIDGGPIL